jgi:hypothetical protein
MNFEDVRQIALSFPGVEEHTIFGGPTFKVGKRFLASHAKVDPDALCLKLPDQLQRDFLVSSQPEIYYAPEHYANYGSILVRLSKVDPDDLRELFETAWRAYAPKKLVANYPNGTL